MSAPLTPEQEARIREIVREEMDADEVWLRGPHDRIDLPRYREAREKSRAEAIERGRREDMGGR